MKFGEKRVLRAGQSYASPRQTYASPRLTTYGLFREMTASGSGTLTENNAGGGQPARKP